MTLVDPNSDLFQIQGELERMTRLYGMFSQINRAIVRAEDPQYLFNAICRIAVDHGGFSLAWIGLAETGVDKVTMVAHAGAASSILKMHFMNTVQGTERQSPASRAILNEEPCVVNYLLADSLLHSCHRELAAHDLQAAASFPLRLEGRVTGAFTVAATRPGYFNDKELRLLSEVAEDVSFALGVMRREEQRSVAESKMQYLAYYDAQTGLPNRVMFETRLSDISRHATSMVVLAISLTRYHGVLQTLGQSVGAEMSSVLANRLEGAVRSGFVARVNEAEFAVIPDGIKEMAEVEDLATAIHAALVESVWIDGQEVYLEPYVGIALYPQDGIPQTLLSHAIVASNMTPREPGTCYRYFAAHMEHGPKRRLDLETALRRALKLNEFLLYYQPQVDLRSGRVVGVETLMRWNRPGHGMVSPLEFIPLLEETGLIWDAGEWAMHEACRANRAWQDSGLAPIRVAVNLSARQFHDGDIQTMVRRALAESKLDARWLELELTEGIVLLNADSVIRTMQNLNSDGVSHALDDFGTGYSSLSYLQRLPVERLKIDRSFISNINSNPGDAAIARAVVGMAHSLEMSVIAEGVETEGQLGFLRALGCEEIQGYYFSKPLPEQEFVELLRAGHGIMPAPKESTSQRVLLLIDDDQDVLHRLSATLEQDGYMILSTTSTRSGFDILATSEVGVVVCDQRMPEMAGAEFLSRVRTLYPEAVRIVMSDRAEMGPMLDAINSGAVYKVIGKPWDDERARACVHDAFRLYEMTRDNRELKARMHSLQGYG